MNAREWCYKKGPRLRFWLWADTRYDIDKYNFARRWIHLKQEEQLKIIDKIINWYFIKPTFTKDESESEWIPVACVSGSILRFAQIGNPYGHGLNTARYKTNYGEYPHIELPLELPCHLVNTVMGDEQLPHMVNAIKINIDIESIDSWIFFDGAKILYPGDRGLMRYANIFSDSPDIVTIYHGKILNKKNPFIARFTF